MKILTRILLLSSLLATIFLTSCKKDDDDDKSMKLTREKVEIQEGYSTTVTVSNGTAPYAVISSNKNVATVSISSTTITIKGVEQGTAVIKVTDSNSAYTKNINVTVTEATLLSFDKDSISLALNETGLVTVSKGTAPYSFTLTDQAIATVSVAENKITIVGDKAGITKVNVKDKDKKYTGTFTVTVTTNLTFEENTFELSAGESANTTITNGTAPYSASVRNAEVASASIYGRVLTIKGLKVGTTIVDVSDKNKVYLGSVSIVIK